MCFELWNQLDLGVLHMYLSVWEGMCVCRLSLFGLCEREYVVGWTSSICFRIEVCDGVCWYLGYEIWG